MSRNSRPFYQFSGPAYPQILRGDNPTREVRADLEDRNEFYYDSAIQLCEADLERFVSLDGKPLCYEHDNEDEIGYIHHAWVDASQELRIMGRIYIDTPRGREIAQNVKNGHFRGLSVGYQTPIETNYMSGKNTLLSKQFREISLCKEPFFRGCDISVTASAHGKNQETKEQSYLANSDPAKSQLYFWIPLDVMASTQEQPTHPTGEAPQAGQAGVGGQLTPSQVSHSEASEILKEADKLKEQLNNTRAELEAKRKAEEAAKKENDARMARLAYLEQKEQERAAEYAKAQATVADEVIAEQKAAYGADLPEDWERATRETITNPEHQQYAGIITASAKKARADRERAEKLEEQLKAMQERMAKLEGANDVAAKQIRASRAELAEASKPQTGIEEEEESLLMSTTTTTTTNVHEIVCSKPSAAELPIFKELGFFSGLQGKERGVQASGRPVEERKIMTSISAPMVHAQLYDEKGERQQPNSMRWKNPALFSFITSRDITASAEYAKILSEHDQVTYGDPESLGLVSKRRF